MLTSQERPCLSFQEIEKDFWAHVWRCAHPWPCMRCCWPWERWGSEADPMVRWHQCYRYGSFTHPGLPVSIPANRFAYMLSQGAMILPGYRIFYVRHLCDFPPCCNGAHLRLGTQADNGKDRHGKGIHGKGKPSVCFPDGRLLSLLDPPLWATDPLRSNPRALQWLPIA